MHYTKVTYSRNEREVEVVVPKRFGMFTAEGNRRLHNYAKTFMRHVEEGKNARRAALTYLKKWYRLQHHPDFREAADTAVREIVRGFAEEVLTAQGYPDPYDLEAHLNQRAEIEVAAEKE
jgi:hypothetical protein